MEDNFRTNKDFLSVITLGLQEAVSLGALKSTLCCQPTRYLEESGMLQDSIEIIEGWLGDSINKDTPEQLSTFPDNQLIHLLERLSDRYYSWDEEWEKDPDHNLDLFYFIVIFISGSFSSHSPCCGRVCVCACVPSE